MGVYLGLRDGWLWEDDAILDAIEVLQSQVDDTFYPTEYGPESLVDVACPDTWGYLVPQVEAEPFESLFASREDEQIAKLYGCRFAYARWDAGADGEAKASFLPAPVSREEPIAGGVWEKTTWSRFWTWGPAPGGNIDMRCDLATGWCEIEYVSEKRDVPAASFRVAAAKLAPYVTIGEGSRYGERGEIPWMIYDGFYWSYILGAGDAVLLRGTRMGSSEKRDDPIPSLFRSIRKSARGATRRLWGFSV